MDVTQTELRALVVDALSPRLRDAGMTPETADDGLDLFGSGLLNSIGLVDLLVSVEERLGRPLDFDALDFTRLTTLGDLVREIHALPDAPAGTLAG